MADADDAELFVDQLFRHGAFVRDLVLTGVLRGDRWAFSPRAVERRFRLATGLTRGAVAQIERGQTATGMLTVGAPVDDGVEKLGYYGGSQLARMLRRYVGGSAPRLRAGAGGAIAIDPAGWAGSLVTPLEYSTVSRSRS